MPKEIKVGLEAGRLKNLFQEGDKDTAPSMGKVFDSLEELLQNVDPNTVYNIKPEWIDYENFEIRTRYTEYSEEAIAKMAKNIEDLGQIQPSLVRVAEDGKLQLVLGWTRAYGCRKLNRTLKAFVTRASVEACREFAVSENMIRNEYSPYDEFRNTVDLVQKDKKSVAKVSEIMGKSEAYIYSVLKINDVPLVVEALKANTLSSIRAARDLASIVSSKRIPEDLQAKAIAALAAEEVKLTDIQFFIDQKSSGGGSSPAASSGPGPVKDKSGKGLDPKPTKGKEPGDKNYLQKFSDGKLFFTARVFPQKTELREKKTILKEAKKFVEFLEKVVEKEEKAPKDKKR